MASRISSLFLRHTCALHRPSILFRGISTDVAKASSRIHADDQERREIVETALRVDHAGEYAAVRIYEGQAGCAFDALHSVASV